MQKNNQKLLVSVVITTKNEQEKIGQCLNSVASQSYPKESIEVIVVDNDSEDKTKEIAKEFTDKVFSEGPERSSQRNFGMKAAAGEYLLYLDADMSLSSEVISECVQKCESQGYVGLYIPEKIKGKGFWVKVRDFERSFYDATCIDAVRFINRAAALDIGGFDEELTGPEDWDFNRRISEVGNLGITGAVLYHDEGNFNLKKYIEKKCYYAKSFDAYCSKWGNNDSLTKKQLGIGYRLFGVFTEAGKWKKLLKNPGLASGMYFLKFILGINYLITKRKITKTG